ncbi:MAG: helix-turn-helix domain-containing protein [Sulfolobales archaeon]|jgi:sugar-specific transcriptional regulator TrmB|nr:helix-turn-helix domain-containing protein [Sulfolobales archaeon]
MALNLLDELIERVSPYARALGVTKNEVKLYVTLLMEGPLTGKELAQRLGISQVKVYPMLGALVERGWVRKTSERPAKYEAVPLLEVWRSLKDKVYDTVEEIERDVIIPFHSLLSTRPSVETVGVVSGRAVKDALLSVVRRSIRSLDVALAHRALIDDHLVRALEEASKRASVRVLLEHGIELSMPSRVEVKVRKGMFGSGAVGDNSIVLVVETGNVMGAIISNHQFFVSIGRIYFDHLWETA